MTHRRTRPAGPRTRPARRAGVLAALLTALLTALPLAVLPLTGLPTAAATTTPGSRTTPSTPTTTSTSTNPDGSRSTDDEDDEDDVTLTLDAVGPATLTPDSTLTVRVTVTNRTDEPLDDLSLQLSLRRARLATTTALDAWADGRTRTGTVVLRAPQEEPLSAGDARTVELTVPADTLGLPGDPFQWGPRGLEVRALDGGTALATTRTFVLWEAAPGGYEPTRVTVVVPLTGPTPDVLTGVVPEAVLADQTGDDGRLGAVLAAAALPGVTWALDPALLGTHPDPTADVPGAADDTDPAQTPGPATQQWRQDLRAAAAGHEVIALPYGDPDTAALVHAGLAAVHTSAETAAGDLAATALGTGVLGGTVRTDIAWPVGGTVDAVTAGVLADAGRPALVLSEGSHPPSRTPATTLTGRSTITETPDPVAGLLVNTRLSEALARTDRTPSRAPAPPTGAPRDDDDTHPATGTATRGETPTTPSRATRSPEARTAAGTAQRLLAETAAITLERPFDPRHLLVTAPRGWDPDPATGTAAVRALTDAPWLDARPLTDLLATEAPATGRQDLDHTDDDRREELDRAVLTRAATARDDALLLAGVLTGDDTVAASAELSLVAVSAGAWREDPQGWRAAVERLEEATAERLAAIRALPGSSLNVVSSNVSLPVTVVNDLDAAASVQVRLRPRSSRLAVTDTVGVDLPANSQRRVSVPVRAVGSGNTAVDVEILTPQGQVLGDPVSITVRVRAEWETRGTLVVGGLVGLVLLAGVVRAILRGRRQRELAATADPTGDAAPDAADTGDDTRDDTDPDAAADPTATAPGTGTAPGEDAGTVASAAGDPTPSRPRSGPPTSGPPASGPPTSDHTPEERRA